MSAKRWVRAIGRATLRSLSRPPRESWSRREHFVVHVLRELLRELVDAEPAVQRRMLAKPGGKLPADVTERRFQLGGVEAWEWTPEGADPDRRLVYFHGGGYVIGHPLENRSFVCGVAHRAGVPAVAVRYRLAPEHPHPAAMEDGEATVRALLDEGVAPEGLVLMGDSAGGGIALGTLVRLRDAGLPRVAGAILGSPMVDLQASAPSYEANAATDYLPREMVTRWAELATDDLSDPSISLRHAELSGLPPLRFLVGDVEVFRDDVLACARSAEEAGVDVDTWVGRDAVHCWYSDPNLPGPDDDGRDRVALLAKQLLALSAEE